MKFDKSRVYTAVNADELHQDDAVILAHTMKDLIDDVSNIRLPPSAIYKIEPIDCEERFTNEGGESYALAYLIECAEEKKQRPYKDTDEMIADYKKRFNADCPEYKLPLIWVKDRTGDTVNLVTVYSDKTVCLSATSYELPTLFDYCTYLDGSPCGMEE